MRRQVGQIEDDRSKRWKNPYIISLSKISANQNEVNQFHTGNHMSRNPKVLKEKLTCKKDKSQSKTQYKADNISNI